MKDKIKVKRVANLMLVASLSASALASEQPNTIEDSTRSKSQIGATKESSDYESTYWGLGLGTVLGGVIAGPPGIAIGASIGSALGWGKDQNEAYEKSQEALQAKVATQRHQGIRLEQHQKELKSAQQMIEELELAYQVQTHNLKDLQRSLEEKEQALFHSDLAQMLNTYSQEVYFEKGEARLPAYAKDRIVTLAEFLKRRPEFQINLTGYTDQSGPAQFNQQLSQSRAEGVRDLLVSEGVSVDRILLSSQGESKAEVAEGDHSNAILDRRVAITFQLPEGHFVEEGMEKSALEENLVEEGLAEESPEKESLIENRLTERPLNASIAEVSDAAEMNDVSFETTHLAEAIQ